MKKMLKLILEKLLEQRDSLVFEIRSFDYSDDYFEEKLEVINDAIEVIDDKLKIYYNEITESNFQKKDLMFEPSLDPKNEITGISSLLEVSKQLKQQFCNHPPHRCSVHSNYEIMCHKCGKHNILKKNKK